MVKPLLLNSDRDNSMVTTRGKGEQGEREGKGEINGDGGDMTWGGDTRYKTQMMCHRIVPLKPLILLTNVTLIHLIKRKKALYFKKKTCISNELKGGLETGSRNDRTLQ